MAPKREEYALAGIGFGLLKPSLIGGKPLSLLIPRLGEGRGGAVLAGVILLAILGLFYLQQGMQGQRLPRSV